MPISFVGQTKTASVNSITLPTGIVAGDVIIIYAYDDSSTSFATPSGYTVISLQNANSNSHGAFYKISTGSDSGASVSLSSAEVLVATVYRGATGVGGSAGRTGTATTSVNIPAVTLVNSNGASWIVAFYGSAQTTSSAAPTGMTQRGTTASNAFVNAVIADTAAGVSSFATRNATTGASAKYASGAVELIDANASAVRKSLTLLGVG